MCRTERSGTKSNHRSDAVFLIDYPWTSPVSEILTSPFNPDSLLFLKQTAILLLAVKDQKITHMGGMFVLLSALPWLISALIFI